MFELATVVAAASLGAMLFFSAVVAPTVLQAVPEHSAGAFLRALFPRYFVVNGIAAISAGLLAWGSFASALMLVGGLLLLGLRVVAVPVINEARDAMLAGVAEAGARFNRWHRGAVAVNLVEMALLSWALALILGAGR